MSEKICFICLENIEDIEKVIEYNHCGIYYVHNQCLNNWELDECIICRKKYSDIVKDETNVLINQIINNYNFSLTIQNNLNNLNNSRNASNLSNTSNSSNETNESNETINNTGNGIIVLNDTRRNQYRRFRLVCGTWIMVSCVLLTGLYFIMKIVNKDKYENQNENYYYQNE